MIEHVGHEYMEEFFRCCDSLLAEDGLFVLQVIKQMMSYIFFPLLWIIIIHVGHEYIFFPVLL